MSTGERVQAGPFDLSGSGKLGIQFKTVLDKANPGVKVISVQSTGLIAEWNASHEATEQILPGVHICEWSGQTGRARDLFNTIKEGKSDLRLVALTGLRHHLGIEKALERVFHIFDVSGSGDLDLEEFAHVAMQVALEVGEELDEDGMEVADKNGDGKLSFDEFFDYTISMFETANLPLDALEVVLESLARRQEESLDPNASLQRAPTTRTFKAFAKLQESRAGKVVTEELSDGSGDEA